MTKAKEPAAYYSAAAIHELVVWKYRQPAWIVLGEVRDGTGFSTEGKSADAIAFGVWPSRGLSVVGFEFKSSRSDWLRELKDPAKAESMAQFCDEWWLVAAENVANIEEIPSPWGWYIPTAKGLKCAKVPMTLTPKEISRPLLMSIVRKVSNNYTPTATVKADVEARAEVLAKERFDSNTYRLKELEELQKRICKFREVSGIDLLQEWRFPVEEVGEIVKHCLEKSLPYEVQKLEAAANAAIKAVQALRELEAFKRLEKDKKP